MRELDDEASQMDDLSNQSKIPPIVFWVAGALMIVGFALGLMTLESFRGGP